LSTELTDVDGSFVATADGAAESVPEELDILRNDVDM
jgi:hypothetical protein